MRNIVLCGFMGCGKSTVGAALAELLDMRFIDMDAFIEEQSGMTVPEIFQKMGEPYFRTLETRCAETLSLQSGLVVSTGGGALLSPANAAFLKKSGVIVLIDVPLSLIECRLAGDTSRPLLNRADKSDEMRRLYGQRMSAYRAAADYCVQNEDDRPAEQMAQEIAGALRLTDGL